MDNIDNRNSEDSSDRTVDKTIIEAFFREEHKKEAKTYSGDFHYHEAPWVYLTEVAGYEVQVDALCIPGCSLCTCNRWGIFASCPHLYYAMDKLADLWPNFFENLVPNVSKAVHPEMLKPAEVYWFKKLPLTHSGGCAQESYCATIIRQATDCIELGYGDEIAEHLKSLVSEYLDHCWQENHEMTMQEIVDLSQLLCRVGYQKAEVLSLWRAAIEGQDEEFLYALAPDDADEFDPEEFLQMLEQCLA